MTVPASLIASRHPREWGEARWEAIRQRRPISRPEDEVTTRWPRPDCVFPSPAWLVPVQCQEGGGKPTLDTELTTGETEEIRQAAAEEDTGVEKPARASLLASLHHRRVMAAAVQATQASAGLNERLAR